MKNERAILSHHVNQLIDRLDLFTTVPFRHSPIGFIWTRMRVLNVAGLGIVSSARTIREIPRKDLGTEL